jgi:hypothetical protein
MPSSSGTNRTCGSLSATWLTATRNHHRLPHWNEVRLTRIERASTAWRAVVLPLNDRRILANRIVKEPRGQSQNRTDVPTLRAWCTSTVRYDQSGIGRT